MFFGHNHAGGDLVSKLWIKRETQFSKKLQRFIEIFYR